MLTANEAHRHAMACFVRKVRADMSAQLLIAIEAEIEAASSIGGFELEVAMQHSGQETPLVAFVIEELRNRGFVVTGRFDGKASTIRLEW